MVDRQGRRKFLKKKVVEVNGRGGDAGPRALNGIILGLRWGKREKEEGGGGEGGWGGVYCTTITVAGGKCAIEMLSPSGN